MSAKVIFILLWPLIFLGSVSCSHFSKVSNQTQHYIANQDYDKAIEVLKPLAEKESDDQLVYLLDYATVLHLAGKYDESIRAFLKADDIAAIKDYHSLSRVAGSILLNEGMVQYKGDDFEKVFIHVYLALNFLMKSDLNGALVEARRTNEILQKYRDEAKKDYDQNALAFYLSGLIWEADKKWDDAYIAYKDALNRDPTNKTFQIDVYRLSKFANRQDETRVLFEKLGVNLESVRKLEAKNSVSKNDSELIVIYQNGRGPIKKPHPSFPRIPKLYPYPATANSARVQVIGESFLNPVVRETKSIYSVTDVAIKTLDDQYAALIAKRAAGIAAKYTVAKQIGKKDDILGAIAWVGMNIADQADLRQWSTLPADIQVTRIKLPPGNYSVSIEALDYQGSPLSMKMSSKEVEVKPRQKTFLTWRAF